MVIFFYVNLVIIRLVWIGGRGWIVCDLLMCLWVDWVMWVG